MTDLIKKYLLELAYYILGLFYLIMSVLIFPYTLFQVFKSLFSRKDKYYAFTDIDEGFRNWYNKISLDFSRFNRAGYSWDDGLGLSLASRAYNNKATYFLSGTLGQLKLATLGRMFWVITIFFLVSTQVIETTFIALVVAFLLFFSPLISQVYTMFGKPEVFWWFVAPIISYFAFSQPLVAAFIWSLVAFVNAPAAFLVALSILFPSFLFQVFIADYEALQVFYFVLLTLPGGLKLLVRLVFMNKTNFLNILGREQSGLWKRDWKDLKSEWVSYALVSISLYLTATELNEGFWLFLILFFPVVFISYLNWRTVYINDEQSFLMLFCSYTIALSSVSHSSSALAVSLLLSFRIIYFPNFLNYFSEEKRKVDSRFFKKWLHFFSSCELIEKSSYKKEPLYNAFRSISRGSRILILTESRLRSSKYRHMIETLRFVLLENEIAQLNDMYGSMQSESLTKLTTENYILNASQRDLSNLIKIFEKIHVHYLITFDSNCAKLLTDSGCFSYASNENYYNGLTQFQAKNLKVYVLKSNTRVMDFRFIGQDVHFYSNISGELVLPFAYYQYLDIRSSNKGSSLPVSEYYFEDLSVSLCKVNVVKGERYLLSCRKLLV